MFDCLTQTGLQGRCLIIHHRWNDIQIWRASCQLWMGSSKGDYQLVSIDNPEWSPRELAQIRTEAAYGTGRTPWLLRMMLWWLQMAPKQTNRSPVYLTTATVSKCSPKEEPFNSSTALKCLKCSQPSCRSLKEFGAILKTLQWSQAVHTVCSLGRLTELTKERLLD